MVRSAPLLVACLCLALAAACRDAASQRVDVDLTEWAVAPSTPAVDAGSVTFVAHNRSGSMIHELAILKIEGDNKKTIEEIEDLDPGASKQVTVKLAPGTYELACVIVPGEAGSTVDHYQQGMHSPFTVR